VSVPELESMLTAVRFVGVSVKPKPESCEFVNEGDPDRDLSDYVVSTTITEKNRVRRIACGTAPNTLPRWRSRPTPALTTS